MAVNFNGASMYNVFTFEDLNQSNTDIEGLAAVGGNITLSNVGVSSTISPLPPFGSLDTLIIRGSVNISGGQNFAGNTVASPASTIIQYTMNNPNGEFRFGTPVDFNAIRAYIECASNFWEGLVPNGTASVSFGQLTLAGNDPALNIFQFNANNVAGSGLALNGLNGINIVAPLSSTILINVTGTNIAFGSYQIFRNGNAATRANARLIAWNFPQALTWTNSTTAIFGSVLAPFAAANTTFSQTNGNFIVKTLNGNIESHNELFEGSLPDPIACLQPTTSSTTSSTTSTTTSSTTSSTTSTSTTSSTSSTTSTSTTSTTSSTTSTSTSSSTSSTSSTSTSSSTSSTSSTSTSSTTSTTTADPFIPGLESIILGIGSEELALGALIQSLSAEVESASIGFANGTIALSDLISFNSQVAETVKSIIKKEIVLENTLDEAIRLLEVNENS